MENREENLQKTDERLEKLDDEQLEQVTGGKLINPIKHDTKNPANQSQNQGSALGVSNLHD